ncbi:formate dehydrogenase accessory sulfurtransferase FdhD [Aureimonas psammosilenae]|uniref:formate dehydrogenase accessory sulfurtransferase FdhD n=1 Tax=Aureimonas psammosilenae TaxID=2495496 RepID=UPI001F1DEC57|nr:formate dehydrogenase accessory sulfurtransferase FdhD [Aureimonas psammosilenae]
MSPSRPVLLYRGGSFSAGTRSVPDEVAVAISVDGSTHAVMMATPRDLEDLGIGLALNERIVASLAEIEHLEVVETEVGLDCQIRLVPERGRSYVARRRQMTGPVGCGLCGVESLELAVPPLPCVSAGTRFEPSQIVEAMGRMAEGQVLGRQTRAVHAAAFVAPGAGDLSVREDVGRHNALDKVAGDIARRGLDPATGMIAITSRVSVELIQKCATMGVPLLAAVSVPTELAIQTATSVGLTLAAVARGEDFEVFTHPERVIGASEGDG